MKYPHYRDQSITARLYFLARAVANTIRRRCTDQPKIARGGDSPAYGHWRCERHRGHEGPHRSVNYVWYADGATDYQPVPPDLSAVTRLT